MADQQIDIESPQQRKRIAVAVRSSLFTNLPFFFFFFVAIFPSPLLFFLFFFFFFFFWLTISLSQCGRCRKRKIRCSGDSGGGQPCQNCKNAGAEQCLFLRVSDFGSSVHHLGSSCSFPSDSLWVQVHSREAPFLSETGDFGYNVGDARQLASRAAPVTVSGMSYPQQDSLSSGVGSPPSYHPYVAATAAAAAAPSKQYYNPGFNTGQYNDEFDYGMGVPPQPLLNNDGTGVAMISGQWPSRPSSSKPYQSAPSAPGTNQYNMESSPYYGGATSLVHRPTQLVASEPSTLALSGFGAEMPPSSSARLLPDPALAVRQASSSSLPPYPAAKTPVTSGATLAHVAAAATYVSSYDGSSGLNYSSPPGQHLPSSSRSDEGLFGEQERSSLQSQGSGYEMTTYTSEPRRDSMATSTSNGTNGGGGGGTLCNGHTYIPSEPMHTTPHILPGYLGGGGEVTTPASAVPHSTTPIQSQSSHHDRIAPQQQHEHPQHSHMHSHPHAHHPYPHHHHHHASPHAHSHAGHNSHSHGHGHHGSGHDHPHAHGPPPPTSAPSPSHHSGVTHGSTSHADAHRVAVATRR